MLVKVALPLLAYAGSAVAQLPSITMKGQKFFFENGTQFYMKGVAYQQDTAASDGGGEGDSTFDGQESYRDPLADEDRCREDIPLLAELGTNTIRTYAINPEADHTFCMDLLQEHGIYVVSDLGEPSLSINRDDPRWDTQLFDRYKGVVDELSQYSNVIGFFAGNEVSNNKSNTQASAFVMAAVRDTKAYIKEMDYRWMGVGYAANDDPDIRIDIAHYFNCGPEEDAIDFWGYNIYSWCGESTLEESGYNAQADFFRNYSVPVFFAEYGCNNDGAENRIFQETGALYEDEMTEVFSGGIVYMYFQEANDYGLVELVDGEARPNDGFDHLAEEHRNADPRTVQEDNYNPNLSPQECPTISEVWLVDPELPPRPDNNLCNCMVRSRSCVRADDLDPEEFGEIFDYVCAKSDTACAGIKANATSGVYGAYSMCPPGAQLDYVMTAYYEEQDSSSDACDFEGRAQVVEAESESECEDALAEADETNEAAETATTPVDQPESSSAPGGSEEGEEGEDGDNAAPGTAINMYMAAVLAVGAAMVAL